MAEIKPNLRGLPADQVLLAKAHWYTWAVVRTYEWGEGAYLPYLRGLEEYMQPETLHRLALARGRWQDQRWEEADHGQQ